MNPDSAIRPWLLACGKQFGIRQAYNYCLPDQSARPQEPYFTYRILKSTPANGSVIRDMQRDEYDAIWGARQDQETTVRIRLYREVNGVEVLQQCAMLAETAEPLKRFFKRSACAFKEISGDVTDESPSEKSITQGDFTDQIVQQMDVVFNDVVSAQLRETNAIVETLEIDLGF